MSLNDKVKADLLVARKANNAIAKAVLTTLLGEIATREKKFDPARSITDDEILPIIRKFLKDNAEFETVLVNARDASPALDKVRGEATLLKSYLPVQVDAATISPIIGAKVADGETLPKIMSALKAQFGANFDARIAAQMIKEKIASRA